MDRPYDIITFDCYGTLIDWESGIRSAFAAAAARLGVAVDLDEVVRLHAEIEPVVEAERFRSYREVLNGTAERMAARMGWPPADGRFLAESVPDWRPFPDTGGALEALAEAGYRLGILSNVDDDLLAGTLRHFPVRFELLVTAQQVRAYKPAAAHFLTARERMGRVRWLHAAQSLFHDVQPAASLGIPVVWVNRKAEARPADVHPTGEVLHARGLVAWLRDRPAAD